MSGFNCGYHDLNMLMKDQMLIYTQNNYISPYKN